MSIISKQNCLKVDLKVISIFILNKNIFWKAIKMLGKAPKNRCGRVTGSTAFFVFLLGLTRCVTRASIMSIGVQQCNYFLRSNRLDK